MDYSLKPEIQALMDQITGMESVQKALAFLKEDHENSIADSWSWYRFLRLPSMRKKGRNIWQRNSVNLV